MAYQFAIQVICGPARETAAGLCIWGARMWLSRRRYDAILRRLDDLAIIAVHTRRILMSELDDLKASMSTLTDAVATAVSDIGAEKAVAADLAAKVDDLTKQLANATPIDA